MNFQRFRSLIHHDGYFSLLQPSRNKHSPSVCSTEATKFWNLVELNALSSMLEPVFELLLPFLKCCPKSAILKNIPFSRCTVLLDGIYIQRYMSMRMSICHKARLRCQVSNTLTGSKSLTSYETIMQFLWLLYETPEARQLQVEITSTLHKSSP